MCREGDVVWLVWAYQHIAGPYRDEEVTHVFSTKEKAEEWCHQDTKRTLRDHVISDCMIDYPERKESPTQ